MRLLLITVRIALRALRRNIMRSLLTTLGIIIGVAAVIAMVSIGQGASVSVQEQIARMGNNMLIILSGTTTQGGVRSGLGGASTLTTNDARAIQRECPAVGAVTYTASSGPTGRGRQSELEHRDHRCDPRISDRARLAGSCRSFSQ